MTIDTSAMHWNEVVARAADFTLNGPQGTAADPAYVSTTQALAATTGLTKLRINQSASGDTTLVAAVSGQTTRVHRLRISVAGATILTIKYGATVNEVWNFAGAGGAIVLDFDARPYFITPANTTLVLNSSAAVQVDGSIEYVTGV